jgi:large subunit ribosomal protein L35
MNDMPKMKTHKGAKARIKITGSGRLRRRQQNRGHIMEKKSSTRTRRLSNEVEIHSGDEKRIKRMLGI